MKIRILCVGKIKEEFYRTKIKTDTERIRKYCDFEIIEVEDEKTAEHMSETEINKVKQREGERLQKYLKGGSDEAVIALCIDGKMHSSDSWNQKLQNWIQQKELRQITYIIGGSLGLDRSIIKQAHYQLSISRLTFPHNLMRVLLTEQIADLVSEQVSK